MSGTATQGQSSPVSAARSANSISMPGASRSAAVAMLHPCRRSQRSSRAIIPSTMSTACPLANSQVRERVR